MAILSVAGALFGCDLLYKYFNKNEQLPSNEDSPITVTSFEEPIDKFPDQRKCFEKLPILGSVTCKNIAPMTQVSIYVDNHSSKPQHCYAKWHNTELVTQVPKPSVTPIVFSVTPIVFDPNSVSDRISTAGIIGAAGVVGGVGIIALSHLVKGAIYCRMAKNICIFVKSIFISPKDQKRAKKAKVKAAKVKAAKVKAAKAKVKAAKAKVKAAKAKVKAAKEAKEARVTAAYAAEVREAKEAEVRGQKRGGLITNEVVLLNTKKTLWDRAKTIENIFLKAIAVFVYVVFSFVFGILPFWDFVCRASVSRQEAEQSLIKKGSIKFKE